MRILTRDIGKHGSKTIQIRGWLHKKRKLGGLNFILVRDRAGVCQVLVESDKEMEKLRGLQTGTVLSIQGAVHKDKRAPGGAEIHDPKITVEVSVEEEPPIEIDKPLDHTPGNLDTLFEHRVLGLRNLREQTIFRAQATLLAAARAYFKENEFVEFNSPKLLAEATEGGAEVFKLDYFGQEASLAQSAQFYKQILVGAFERVYEINPTYRAELSATTRHMAEFITIDAEMGFLEFDELLEFSGGMLRRMVDEVWAIHGDELKAHWNAKKPVLPKATPSITMKKVHELYSKAKGEDTTGEHDLRPDEERWICEYAAKELGSDAVFVTEWPIASMKFYHRKNAKDPTIVDRADLLLRGVEIATVPMREHRYDVLVQQLKQIAGGDPEHPGFRHYLNAFRYGLPPHGGFGWGLERTTEKLVGLANVKEATLFPRDINRLSP